jgi:hypothetical protein
MFAIYLNDYERIAAIDSNLWIAHSAAKVLSSKFSLSIVEISNVDSINNDNCLEWTLSSIDLPISVQYPKLVIPSSLKIVKVGNPAGIDILILEKSRQYILKSVKIIQAAKITDALLNNADRLYFQRLLEVDGILSTPDDSGIAKGFLFSIEQAVYLSAGLDELENNIQHLLTDQNSIFPRNLLLYKNTFYKYLNG